jgi:hypothetical protein
VAIQLKRLVASGPGKVDAEIVFGQYKCLIRGPSDTGKSHIRECLAYLLGGEKPIKRLPYNQGYETLTLEFTHDGSDYSVVKAFAGGGVLITKIVPDAAPEVIGQELGEFLVRLSGAAGKQIIRSRSKKGNVTGGDLRHWFLISQTDIISEDPTAGEGGDMGRIQRAAAFYVFLTGMDDAAIVLAKSRSEKDSINGQILAAEIGIKHASAGLPPDLTKPEVVDALEKVDNTLAEITRQYNARARQLRALREDISINTTELRSFDRIRSQSQAMVMRFNMLDEKYKSDLERLDAGNEGMAYFQALKTVPCPLCSTPVEQQVSPADLRPSAPANYRVAVQAEANKIRALRVGLAEARTREIGRVEKSSEALRIVRSSLNELEGEEQSALRGIRVEFSSDPKELAVRRSELSSQLNLFEDIERLRAEIEKLKQSRGTKASPIARAAIEPAKMVADIARDLLVAWGFKDVTSVELDLEECDLKINGRPRLNYGAGRRGVSLAALFIAILKNALDHGHPHIGFVVIDSPLKAYADPTMREAEDRVSPAMVRDNFYSWLSQWSGPGQIIVLENEPVTNPAVAAALKPIEFTGPDGADRRGFYPELDDLLSPPPASPGPSEPDPGISQT